MGRKRCLPDKITEDRQVIEFVRTEYPYQEFAVTCERGYNFRSNPAGWFCVGRDEPGANVKAPEEGALSLFINVARGFEGESCEFLKQIGENVEFLDWVGSSNPDLRPVGELASLRHLSIQPDADPMRHLGLGNCSKLISLAVDWPLVVDTVFSCTKLLDLTIDRVPEGELQEFGVFSSLRALKLTRCRTRSLEFLKGNTEIESLELETCRNISDLSPIGSLKKLRRLSLDGCRAIESLEPLAELTNLEILRLRDVGTIPSLSPVANCKSLLALSCGGRSFIEDRDLSSIAQLPNLTLASFSPPTKYSHRVNRSWNWNDFGKPGLELIPKSSKRR